MPLRLAILGPSPCDRCHAACCKRSASEYAVLLIGDAERRRFGPWAITLAVRESSGDEASAAINHERVIPYRADGRCPFLGDDDLCTIYEDRPSACRAFECTRHFNQHGVGRHGIFLQSNERVARLLAEW